MLRQIKEEELQTAFELEKASYPGDEAASLETMTYRMKNCGEFFCVYVDKTSKEMVGLVNGTKAKEEGMTHDSMFEHVKEGQSLNIHSVAVRKEDRRKGIGSKITKEYVKYSFGIDEKLKRINLMCKKNLIGFYESCGFKLIGESKIEWGQEKWYEMFLLRPEK